MLEVVRFDLLIPPVVEILNICCLLPHGLRWHLFQKIPYLIAIQENAPEETCRVLPHVIEIQPISVVLDLPDESGIRRFFVSKTPLIEPVAILASKQLAA
ncbi:MAG: hypothetical protein ACOCYU_05860 [Brevefilum sp.]